MSELTLAAEETDDPIVLRRKLRGALTRIDTLEKDLGEIESFNSALAEAYIGILRAMRDHTGACRVCGAPIGGKHREACVAWDAIHLRYPGVATS